MKIVPSPLVASLHGSAAGLTCATWKGRQYARKKVVPANPKSAAQVLVRDSMARCVTMWRSLDATIKAWLDTYGTAYRMSGFNVYTQKNRALEQAIALLKPVPDNPNIAVPGSLAFATGAGLSGDIDVTWLDDAPTGITHVILACRLTTAQVFEAIVNRPKADLTVTINLDQAGEDYDCYGWWFDSTLNTMGTVAGELAVTTKA